MYRLKISGEQFQSEIEGAQEWSRSVIRDFKEKLFRTSGEYQFTGHKGLYNLLYNSLSTNGVCNGLAAKIYFNEGNGWDHEWTGSLLLQDFEFDILKRGAAGQIIDNSWASKFNNSQSQKVFLNSTLSKNGVYIGECPFTYVQIFDPTTGNYDIDLRVMYRVYDVFQYLVKYYTDDTVTFTSDYFDYGGDGEIYFITRGSEIRAVQPIVNPEVSFAQVFSEMDKKLNIWIIIEGTPDAPVLRIEGKDYVFQQQKILEVRDPENFKLTTDLSQLYSTISIGSDSYKFDPAEDAHFPSTRFYAWDSEQYNLSGDCQFENNNLDLVSEFKIDNNSIERQIAQAGLDTGDFDDDIFIIAVERIGGFHFAIRYTNEFTFPITEVSTDTVIYYIYNKPLLNLNVIQNWFDGIPSEVVKEVGEGISARVSNPQATVTGPIETLQFTDEVSPPNHDEDSLWILPADDPTDNYEYRPNISGEWRIFVHLEVSVPDPYPTAPITIGVIAKDSPGGATIWTLAIDEVIIPASPSTPYLVTLEGELFVTMTIGQTLTPIIENTIPFPALGLDIVSGYSIFEFWGEVNLNLDQPTPAPLIYLYTAERIKMTRAEFDLIDQGRGFVRIIDTHANRSYDLWAKNVRYNSWTCIAGGEFIGRQAPIELCWILDTGYWNDDCFWNDDDFWNEPAFRPFIITVDTTLAGVSANDAFRLPTTGGGYNYTVDWGDGQVDTGQTGTREHTYGAPGIYTIKVYGDFPRIFFDATDDCLKIITIDQWGDVVWSSMADAFRGCANMQGNFSDAPVLVICESFVRMFAGCTIYDWDMDNWDTSTITTMQATFFNCAAFNGNVTTWDVSLVITFTDCFRGATVFNQDITGWDTSSATNMFSMFLSASAFNQAIGVWNVSNVTTFEQMFRSAVAFNQALPWTTSAATTMAQMFFNATAFEQDIGSWDISIVANLNNFMTSMTLNTVNYDALLIGWTGWTGGVPTRTVQPNLTPNFGGSTYSLGTDAEDARSYLIATEGWTITDGGGV